MDIDFKEAKEEHLIKNSLDLVYPKFSLIKNHRIFFAIDRQSTGQPKFSLYSCSCSLNGYINLLIV